MFENVRHCGKSDIGRQRHTNEDSLLIVGDGSNINNIKQLGVTFVVADGLGGHAVGEIASRLACEEVIASYYRADGQCQGGPDNWETKLGKLEQAIRSAHNKIIHLATAKREWRGMGTTLSALVLTEDKVLIAHVGDSRIYRYRNNEAQRLTIDHTKRQDLIDRGLIEPEDDNNRHYGLILTRTLGGYDDLEAIFTRVDDLQPGDAFLLCTDGLHDLLTDDEIQEILVGNSLPQAACEALVQAAIGKGGGDDITVIVVHA